MCGQSDVERSSHVGSSSTCMTSVYSHLQHWDSDAWFVLENILIQVVKNWSIVQSTPLPGAPVYAGFRVSDLVEAGDLEAVGVASLTLVHEVAEGQHHLQDLSQPLAPNNLLGRIKDGWRGKRRERQAAGEIILLVINMCALCLVCH